MIIDKTYFTSTISVDTWLFSDTMGLIESVASNGTRLHFFDNIRVWSLDSGTFNRKFDKKRWQDRMLMYEQQKNKCAFIVVPDEVYDYKKTLDMFYTHSEFPRSHGFPVALVTQDGLKPSDIPFDMIDVLFIGGSDAHKLGEEARACIDVAKENGTPVHVGRVNSVKRIKMFGDCTSWDGTHLNHCPKDAHRYSRAIRQIRSEA